MKKIIYSVLICFVLGLGNLFAQAKPEILIVGTFHFSSAADIFNPAVDDVMSPQRQKEIQEVNALLKKFAPTYIGIEQTANNTAMGERYQQFLQGKYELGKNEIYQITFRLGKELGHQKLYQIDADGNFPYGEVQDFAKLANQTETMSAATAIVQQSVADFNSKQKTSTIRELLLFLNDQKEIDKGQVSYLKFARIGSDSLYPGVNLLSAWYERNLKIFANITRLPTKPNDRILILIGAGHLPILRQLARESGDYTVKDVKDYLGN